MKYLIYAIAAAAVFAAGRWSLPGASAPVPAATPTSTAATPSAPPAPTAPNLRTVKRQSDVIPKTERLQEIRLGKIPSLPPLPEGVADLTFADFYQMPAGPRGLEFTDKIKALQGRRVRIAGFQVAEKVSVCNAEPNSQDPVKLARAMVEASVPGRLLLCALPESVNFSHYGLCDDLPPQVLYVTVPEAYGEPLPQLSGPLLLTGTLDLGNKVEPDGRVSSIRLRLDRKGTAPAPATATASQPTTTNTIQ